MPCAVGGSKMLFFLLSLRLQQTFTAQAHKGALLELILEEI